MSLFGRIFFFGKCLEKFENFLKMCRVLDDYCTKFSPFFRIKGCSNLVSTVYLLIQYQVWNIALVLTILCLWSPWICSNEKNSIFNKEFIPVSRTESFFNYDSYFITPDSGVLNTKLGSCHWKIATPFISYCIFCWFKLFNDIADNF